MSGATGRGEGGAGLLPCPFCGFAKFLSPVSHTAMDSSYRWIVCPKCKTCGPQIAQPGWNHSDADLDIAGVPWNRRASQPAAIGGGEGAEVECLLRQCVAAFDAMRADGFAKGPLPGEYDTAEENARAALTALPTPPASAGDGRGGGETL